MNGLSLLAFRNPPVTYPRAMEPHIVAFIGGGSDGSYLRSDGWGSTRERGSARVFRSVLDAGSFMDDYRLLGCNRPRRAVMLVPMRP